MTTSIQIKNQFVIDRVNEEKDLGAGRNSTESAENLILEAVELRRAKRAASERRGSKAPAVA